MIGAERGEVPNQEVRIEPQPRIVRLQHGRRAVILILRFLCLLAAECLVSILMGKSIDFEATT